MAGDDARADRDGADGGHLAQARVDRAWARVASMGREFSVMGAGRIPPATLRHGRGTPAGFAEDGTRDAWVIGVDEDPSGVYQLAVLDDGRWAVWSRRADGGGDETLVPATWSSFARFFSVWADLDRAGDDDGEDAVEEAIASVRATLAARLRG